MSIVNMMDSQETGPSLMTLDPPKPPEDIIQSALFVPISAINKSHKGRKIRTIGQVIAFDVKSSLLLIAAVATQSTGPLSTLLVNTSIPLLGQTPALQSLPPQDGLYSRDLQPHPRQSEANIKGMRIERRPLSLERGGFVTVVGWLESDQSKLSNQVDTGTAYLRPLPLELEAIYMANSRPPPDGAVYRGTIKEWDGDVSSSPT